MQSPLSSRPVVSRPYPEIWGGVECTLNRIGNSYFDQLLRSGHATRLEDLDRFADLGIRALRVPLLWERMQPERDTVPDWAWSDKALVRLKERGVRPILGLLHHGYGPRWSGLLHPEFPQHLAQYAETVAARYPWVDAYTPVNEPLTTARFSGLYGHWYPHACDARVFAQLLLAQCRATVEAMRAVRRVNSGAHLIQTEDLGEVTGTPTLAYQCDFENERRWLTWDLLTGSVDPSHSMWEYLCSLGIAERELWEFVESPCTPNVIGVNHYITSERFLDDRVENSDVEHVGGNDCHRYRDIATVHAPDKLRVGIEALLRETWERYTRPLAVTECHIGCTREEQLRWLHETWCAARHLCDLGVDVRGVTSWALIGLYDWDSLVTREDGHYETGAFDLRAPRPRATALATMVHSLATRGEHIHPVLETTGWWHGRLSPASQISSSGQCVLITGAMGTLGQALARICESRGIVYQLVSRAMLDIAEPKSVASALAYYRPWAVINAAGYVRVDAAEGDQDRCWRENTIGPAILAESCTQRGVPLVTYSSDLVFNGWKGSAYVESDALCPTNCYGESKSAAELAVLAVAPESLVIRTSAFFGPWDPHNLLTQALYALRRNQTFIVPSDMIVTPTYVSDLAHATLDLLLDGENGIWHLSNGTPIMWRELVCRAAEPLAIPTELLIVCPTDQMGFSARRPLNSALTSERGWIMPTLNNALARYTSAISEQWYTRPAEAGFEWGDRSNITVVG